MTSLILFLHIIQASFSFSCETSLLVGDQLDQWYAVNGSEVSKLTTEGKVLSTYSAPSLGPIEHIDVSNPLKPFIFYPELGKVVYLNTMMAPIDPELDLFSFEGQITAVCGSIAQHIWMYDSNAQVLRRYDQFLNEVVTTGSLRTWVADGWQTKKMAEFDGELFVWNGANRILVFDLFGTYLRETRLFLGDTPEADLQFVNGGRIDRIGSSAYFVSNNIQLQEDFPLYADLSSDVKLAVSAKYVARYDGKRVLLEKGRVLKP